MTPDVFQVIDDLLTDALASFRLTRLVTTDTLVDRYRDAVVRAAYVRAGRGEQVRAALTDPDEVGAWSGFARRDQHPPKLAEWSTCPYCAGVACSALVLVSRRWGRPGRALAALLAVAGAQALLSQTDAALG